VRVRAGRRLDHAIVIRAGPRSDPLSWPAQLASHGGAAAREAGRVSALAPGASPHGRDRDQRQV